MIKLIKFLKKKFGNGFTFLIVPNSSGSVKSIAIPFSLVLVIVTIIIVNIYVCVRYTTQVKEIFNLNSSLVTKQKENAKLKKEQKEVNPTLKKSYRMADELNFLKKERTQLLNIWRSIQKKGGRPVSQASRGNMVLANPYIIPKPKNEDGALQTSLTQLKSNLSQLGNFIKEESKAQHELLLELKAYEIKLDHTPSIWPVQSLITSLFGFRRHPTLGYYKEHTGVDLQARYGTKVMAAADGAVSYAGYRGGYGNAVIIDHGYGYQTLYGHNSKLLVSVGQTVKKGQIISLSGNSGTSSGPHLHYEVRVNNNPVNPTAYLLRN